MQAKRKVLLAFLAFLLVLTTVMAAGVAYVYHHPDLLRHAIEKALSHTYGLSTTIGSLAFSRKPWRIQAHNIVLTPEGEAPGGRAHIGTLEAHAAFSGSLGRRTLSIERLNVAGVALTIPPGARLPAFLSAPPASPSLPVRLLTRLIAFLLFGEIRLVALEVQDGQLTVDTGTHQVQVRGIQGGFGVEHGLEVVCSLDASWAARKARVRVPRLHLFEAAPSEGIPSLSAVRLEATGLILDSPEADIAAMDVLADLRHDPARRRLEVDAAQLRCRRITLKRPEDRTVRLPELALDLSGVVGLGTQALEISGWRLTAENLLALTGTAQANLGLPRAVHIGVQQGSVWPGAVSSLLTGAHTAGKGILQIDGSLQLKGTFEGREAAGAWEWQCDLETSLDANRFAWRSDPWHLSGKVSGTIAARGPIPAVAFSGHLRSPRPEVSGLPVTLDPFQADSDPIRQLSGLAHRPSAGRPSGGHTPCGTRASPDGGRRGNTQPGAGECRHRSGAFPGCTDILDDCCATCAWPLSAPGAITACVSRARGRGSSAAPNHWELFRRGGRSRPTMRSGSNWDGRMADPVSLNPGSISKNSGFRMPLGGSWVKTSNFRSTPRAVSS